MKQTFSPSRLKTVKESNETLTKDSQLYIQISNGYIPVTFVSYEEDDYITVKTNIGNTYVKPTNTVYVLMSDISIDPVYIMKHVLRDHIKPIENDSTIVIVDIEEGFIAGYNISFEPDNIVSFTTFDDKRRVAERHNCYVPIDDLKIHLQENVSYYEVVYRGLSSLKESVNNVFKKGNILVLTTKTDNFEYYTFEKIEHGFIITTSGYIIPKEYVHMIYVQFKPVTVQHVSIGDVVFHNSKNGIYVKGVVTKVYSSESSIQHVELDNDRIIDIKMLYKNEI